MLLCRLERRWEEEEERVTAGAEETGGEATAKGAAEREAWERGVVVAVEMEGETAPGGGRGGSGEEEIGAVVRRARLLEEAAGREAEEITRVGSAAEGLRFFEAVVAWGASRVGETTATGEEAMSTGKGSAAESGEEGGGGSSSRSSKTTAPPQ